MKNSENYYRIERFSFQTESSGWPEPDMRLVEDDRAPAVPLEDDALPAGWEKWIAEESRARGCPRDYVAAALIAAASACVGNARHIRATATWNEPPHLWMALVGEPSTGKTPALRPIIEACRAIERDAEPAWREALSEHAGRAEAAKAVEELWRENVRKVAKEGQPPPDRPSEAQTPQEPPRPRLVAMDATTEELQRMLSGQPRGLLYVRDELAGWLGNHDRYGGHGGDRAFFLEAWNGGVYVVDRVKNNGRSVNISRMSLALLGGLQPDRLSQALTGVDDGLAARLCYIWPEPLPIVGLAAESDNSAWDRRGRLDSATRWLFGLQLDSNSVGEPTPRLLQLDKPAFTLFDEIQQEARRRARSSRGLAAGWHGKMPGRVLRLALVFELLKASCEQVESDRISVDAVVRAGGYADYLSAMLDRVTCGLAIGRTEQDAALLARHILSARPVTLNERELYQQPSWSWLREKDRRDETMHALEKAGWLRRAARSGVGRGRNDWQVSPRLWSGQ
jgi:uncharacterized protein DUF3987